MGRGATDNKSIFYGQKTRLGITQNKMNRREDGVVEYYNASGRLWKATVPKNVSYKAIGVEAILSAWHDEATFWLAGGQLHREDGPAIEYANGYHEYWVRGQLHRDDGPAKEDTASGFQVWYRHGQLHREDGPASIDPDGEESYWLDGKHYQTEARMAPAVEKLKRARVEALVQDNRN